MVTSAEDLLKEMKWSVNLIREKPDSNNRDLLLQLLSSESLTIDEIALSLNQPIEKVSVKLSILQLKGQIEEKEGKYYASTS